MKTTTYHGYTVWPDGLSVWPRRKRTRIWSELEAVESTMGDQRIATTLRFRTGKPLVLQLARHFSRSTAPGRFAELVAQAIAAAPSNVRADELSLEIAQLGPPDRRRELFEPGAVETADRWLERAQHHRVWLEHRRARQAVEQALRLDPNHAAAHRFRHRLALEHGDLRLARRAAEEWQARLPSHAPARAAVLEMRVAQNEAGAATEAADWVRKHPREDELQWTLAAHSFRAGRFQEAADHWAGVAAHSRVPAMRRRAAEMAQYAERIGREPAFRRWEAAKKWGRTGAVWLLIVVAVSAQGWRLYLTATRKEREEAARQAEAARQRERATMAIELATRAENGYSEQTGRVRGDFERVRARAEQGEAAAQLTLAEMYLDGTGGAPKDVTAGIEYLEKAVAQGHRAALLEMGHVLVAGKSIERNPSRAAGMFERAAALGSPRAAAELAELYRKGEGVPADPARAFALYAQAADGGNVYAMAMAGQLLERGAGIPADRARALDFYRNAAAKADAWATERLAVVLMESKRPQEREEATKWLREGGRRGTANVQLVGSVMALAGVVEDPEIERNARVWLDSAVQSGRPRARAQFGRCLMEGWGVPQDFARATAEFEAVAKVDAMARTMLARNLAFGVGVPRDISRAQELRSGLTDPAMTRWLDRYLQVAQATEFAGAPLAPYFQDEPTFPPRRLRAGEAGKVHIQLQINAQGFAENVSVDLATHPEFGLAARLAVSFWRFVPPADGKVQSVVVPIYFTPPDPAAAPPAGK